jgi:hypothetical protein
MQALQLELTTMLAKLKRSKPFKTSLQLKTSKLCCKQNQLSNVDGTKQNS